MKLNRYHIVFAVAASTALASAQVQESWSARYSSLSGSFAVSSGVAIDDFGNVTITGTSKGTDSGQDIVTTKYGPNGVPLWSQTFDGTAHGYDEPTAIKVDRTGNVYVTGLTGGDSTDWVTIKYSPSGQQVWAKTYDGPSHTDDKASGLAIDGLGNVFVTGYDTSGDYREMATIKYDASGAQKWVAHYGANTVHDDEGVAIACGASGDVFVTGTSDDGANSRIATIKYDSAGVQQWVTLSGEAGDGWTPTDIAVDAAGAPCVVGNAVYDMVTIRYAPTGAVMWTNRYDQAPGSALDEGRGVAVDPSGNIMVLGDTALHLNNRDLVLLKLDGASGGQIWARLYDGNRGDEASALAVDAYGNAYVAGRSKAEGTDWNFVALKYGPDGSVLATETYSASGVYSADEANDMALSADGAFGLTGPSTQAASRTTDMLTVVYRQGVTVDPTAYSLFRGVLVSGGLSDLFASDDSRLVVKNGLVANAGEAPIQVVVDGVSPSPTASELRFHVEGQVQVIHLQQTLELWDWTAGAWVKVDQRAGSANVDTVAVGAGMTPNRFIQTGTRAIRAKISVKPAGLLSQSTWRLQLDRVIWIINP